MPHSTMQPFPAISITRAREMPVEILQVILECAFETRPIPVQFALVSWGVKKLIEPFIYHDISLNTVRRRNLFLRTWDERLSPKSTKDAAFYQTHVKGFFIRAYLDADKLVELLLGLPGIQNLSVRLPTRVAPIQFCFDILRAGNSIRPLENVGHLSPVVTGIEEDWLSPPWLTTSRNCECYFKHLRRFSSWAWFRSYDPVEEFTFSHRFFQSLTHLDVLVTSNIPIWNSLCHLRHLTHISFSWMTLDPIPTSEFWEEWVTRLLAACPPTAEAIIFWCIHKGIAPGYYSQVEDSDLLFDLPEEFHRAMSGGPIMPLSHYDAKAYHFLLRLIVGWVDPRAIAGSTDFNRPPDHPLGYYMLHTPYPRLHKGDWDFPDNILDCPDFWTIGEEMIEHRRRATCP